MTRARLAPPLATTATPAKDRRDRRKRGRVARLDAVQQAGHQPRQRRSAREPGAEARGNAAERLHQHQAPHLRARRAERQPQRDLAGTPGYRAAPPCASPSTAPVARRVGAVIQAAAQRESRRGGLHPAGVRPPQCGSPTPRRRAIPASAGAAAAAARRGPVAGNFSRVQWQLDAADRSYTKRVNPETGKPFPEDNWVWSPQGAIDMHMPERWGFVQFSEAAAGTATTSFVEDRNERVKWALRRVYYRQREFHATHGRYASDLSVLDVGDITVEGLDFRPSVQVTDSSYEVRTDGFDGAIVRIRQNGRVWIAR